eukprot:6072608-Pyramimonas_sp.AAC.1
MEYSNGRVPLLLLPVLDCSTLLECHECSTSARVLYYDMCDTTTTAFQDQSTTPALRYYGHTRTPQQHWSTTTCFYSATTAIVQHGSTIVQHSSYNTIAKALQLKGTSTVLENYSSEVLLHHNSASTKGCCSAATSLMQFYYWLSTVSEDNWSSNKVPLLQYYCEE